MSDTAESKEEGDTTTESFTDPLHVALKPKKKTAKNTLCQDLLRRAISTKTLEYYGVLKVEVVQGPFQANVVIPTIRRLEEFIYYQVENKTQHPIFTRIIYANPLLESDQITLVERTIDDFYDGVVNAFGKETRRGAQIFVGIKVSFSTAGYMQINVTC